MDRAADIGGWSADLERALIHLVRLGRLSGIHERVAGLVGVALDRAVYGVLATVGDEGPLRLSDLAARLGVDVSTVSRQITAAEQRGLVQRAPDPDDRRAARLALSPVGHSLLADYRRERRRLLDDALSGWSRADRENLVHLLNRLNDDLAGVSVPAHVTSQGRSTARS